MKCGADLEPSLCKLIRATHQSNSNKGVFIIQSNLIEHNVWFSVRDKGASLLLDLIKLTEHLIEG